MAVDPVVARREALVAILEPAARTVIDRVVEEAVRAAHIFGLTRDRADRYAAGINATLPLVFDAMKMPDGPDRQRVIGDLATAVRAVSDTNHIPRIVERGLVAIAVRIAREMVRRGAVARNFTPEELETEFVAFADRLEDRLFSE